MKENGYFRKGKTQGYYKKSRWVVNFQSAYKEGYIAGLKEMYAVLTEMMPSDILKEFDVTDYIQTKIQEQQ